MPFATPGDQMNTFPGVILALALAACSIGVQAQDTERENTTVRGEAGMSPAELFATMTGTWAGTCRTWFEPGIPADESEVSGEITGVLDGRFLRHTYEGKLKGKPRRGEDLIAFNAVTSTFQSAWVDDFHMNYAIMFSEGKSTDRGFWVRGDYDVGENQPKWG